MAKLTIVKASTDVTVYIFIQNSSLTTGAGLTGLVFNSASLVCYYVRPLAAAAALTLVTQTVTGAHSDGGFVEVDAANMPGVYRLDLSDAVCTTGVNSVVVMLKGATNMAPALLEIQLTNFDLNSANPNVNVTQLSGDSEAADNAESFFDGTGYGQVLQRTTIATLASQTSFTLTAGSADNDAYNGGIIVIQDAATPAQKAVGVVNDYTGSTKTIALLSNPAVFTMAVGDTVTIIANKSLTTTEVYLQILTALTVDAYSEPGQGAPAETATIVDKINYLYKAWRNRVTQTDTTYKLYADNATTVDQKATTSDDLTTFDKGEIVAGP